MPKPVTAHPLPAEVVARYHFDRFVVVTEPDGTRVRVRWALTRDSFWRCDVHGAMTAADCEHTFAAGLLLAEELLGLSRIPELATTATGQEGELHP